MNIQHCNCRHADREPIIVSQYVAGVGGQNNFHSSTVIDNETQECHVADVKSGVLVCCRTIKYTT